MNILGTQKKCGYANFGYEKILTQKISVRNKMWVRNTNLILKLLERKNCAKKNLRTKKKIVYDIFWYEKNCVRKFWVRTKFWVRIFLLGKMGYL